MRPVLMITAAVLIIGCSSGSSPIDQYDRSVSPILERHKEVSDRWRDFVLTAEIQFRETGRFPTIQGVTLVSSTQTYYLETLVAKQKWSSINPPKVAKQFHLLMQQSYDLLAEGLDGIGSCYSFLLRQQTSQIPRICNEAQDKVEESDALYSRALVESIDVFK